MNTNRLEQYLDEIGRTPLLSEEQERQLSARALKGDERAVNSLVEANLRLVVATARKYQGKGLSIDDLISEGNIALVKAATKFDATRGLRFAGYAVVMIRRQMEKALETETMETSVPAEGVARSASRSASLDAPLGIKPNMSLLAVLTNDSLPPTDSRLFSASLLDSVERAVHSLNERERQVVTAYFGIGCEHATMAEIADEMGLKRERVRQIRDRAVRRMKKSFRDER